MKHLKKFEKYINLEKMVDLTKIKKYIITEDNGVYFLDEILDLNKNDDTIHIRSIYAYDKNSDIYSILSELDDVLFIYLDSVIYSSDDLEDVKSHFHSIVDMHKNTKKYNI